MPESKPCPFCGGKAVVKTYINGFTPVVSIECADCKSRTRGFLDTGRNAENIFECIEAWNTRAVIE